MEGFNSWRALILNTDARFPPNEAIKENFPQKLEVGRRMALEGGALAGAWIGGILAGILLLALLLYLFRLFMQVL